MATAEELNRRIPDREVDEWTARSELTKAWSEKLRSRITRANYTKHLYRFHLLTGFAPEQLLEYSKEGKRSGEPIAERMIESQISKARSMGVSKWIIRDMGISVKSFYRENFYGISPKAGRLEIPRVKDYRCPTQEEVRGFTKGMNLRDVALVEFIASAPLREESLSGLKLSSLWSELVNLREDRTIHVTVMGRAMKGGGVGKFANLEQHSFLHKEAADTLRLYLRTREDVKPEDPVFAPVRGEETVLDASSIRSQFLLASQKTGINLSPHDFRRFVQTQLEAARMQPNWIRKIMGKTVKGEEAPYSQPKIEALREAFKSAIPYLTLSPKIDETQIWKAQARQSLEMLQKLGILPESELLRLTERLQRTDDKEEWVNELQPLQERPINGKGEHRLVESVPEMMRLLDEGWEIDRELNGGGKFIMKRRA